MAWAFQGVLNAGLQILLSIFGGWLCGRLHLVDPVILSASLNAFAMKACLPAFVLHLLGVKADLTDLAAWRALGAFVLWVAIIQLGCFVWHKLHRRENMQELGMHCLLLTTNNTGFIGWPVLVATVGAKGASLSMLLSVLLFIQLLPVAVACFEYQKYIDAEGDQQLALSNLAAAAADAPLPVTVDPAAAVAASKDADLLHGAIPSSSFPHKDRYCTWTNADYVPPQMQTTNSISMASSITTQQLASGPVGLAQQQQAAQIQSEAVDVNSTSSSRESVHCDGDTSVPGPRRATADTAAVGSSGRYWRWWRGSTAAAAASGLKRAKDSSSNLQAPLVSGVMDSAAQKQQQQGSFKAGRTTLTRRLSRGQGALATAVAADSSNREAFTPRAAAAMTPATLTSPRSHAAAAAAGCGGGSGVLDVTIAAAPAAMAAGKTPRDLLRSPLNLIEGDSAIELSAMCNVTDDRSASKQHQQGGMNSSTSLGAVEQQDHGAICYISTPDLKPCNLGTVADTIVGSATLPQSTLQIGSAVKSAGSADTPAAQHAVAVDGSSSSMPGWLGQFVARHPLLTHVVEVQLRSPLMWLNFIAIAMSLSGLRLYLDPASPQFVPALGFIDGVMSWFSGACVPVTLFANGVWMADKDVFGGNKGEYKVIRLLLLKLIVLPALMIGVTMLCGLRDANGLGLLLLASCPLAQMAFLMCHQYKAGAELATSLSIQGVLLMLPHMIGLIKICQVAHLYDVPGLTT